MVMTRPENLVHMHRWSTVEPISFGDAHFTWGTPSLSRTIATTAIDFREHICAIMANSFKTCAVSKPHAAGCGNRFTEQCQSIALIFSFVNNIESASWSTKQLSKKNQNINSRCATSSPHLGRTTPDFHAGRVGQTWWFMAERVLRHTLSLVRVEI